VEEVCFWLVVLLLYAFRSSFRFASYYSIIVVECARDVDFEIQRSSHDQNGHRMMKLTGTHSRASEAGNEGERSSSNNDHDVALYDFAN